MNRMESEMRDRVEQALTQVILHHGGMDDPVPYPQALADAALAALGLDDLDVVVVRATDAVHARVVGQHLPRPPSIADIAQAAVIAALTATPESEVSDD